MALGETGRREPATAWANMEGEDVLARLGADRHHGLASEEAARRLAHDGPNRLPPPTRYPVWLRFLLQFHDVLIYMMLVAAGIAALLSHWIDAAVLFAAVIVNAVIGFIQEGKAEATMIIGALGLFLWELDRGASLETARTMAVSAVVMAEMFSLLNSITFTGRYSRWKGCSAIAMFRSGSRLARRCSSPMCMQARYRKCSVQRI